MQQKAAPRAEGRQGCVWELRVLLPTAAPLAQQWWEERLPLLFHGGVVEALSVPRGAFSWGGWSPCGGLFLTRGC